MNVTIDDIHAAARLIEGAVIRTPTTPSRTLSAITGAEVWLERFRFDRNRSSLISLAPADLVFRASAGAPDCRRAAVAA